MAAKVLQEAILDGGIRSVNFFNGRLLTGQDLSREQVARREADRRVAQAAGDGIAWGLEVSVAASGAGPTVTVQPGLAVNREGHTLYLKHATDVLLGERALPRVGATRSFDTCGSLKGGAYAARPGVYVLTLAPAEDREGKTLTHALDDAAVPCNTDTLVEAVQFRLLALDPMLAEAELKDLDLRRNAIAYQCFGWDRLGSFLRDPLGGTPQFYGLLAQIDGKTLTSCDVPLAIVSLQTGIEFLDMWSVRRRVTRRASAGTWSMVADDRRQAEGEAMFLQFQEQITAMTQADGDVRKIEALAHFRRLPPAGILPMPGSAKEDEAAIANFFAGLTVRGPAFIEGARLEPLLRAATAYPPMDLASGELIWLYEVRENREAIDYKGKPAPRAALVFASGHMPYQADARFNVGKWNYANVALDR